MGGVEEAQEQRVEYSCAKGRNMTHRRIWENRKGEEWDSSTFSSCLESEQDPEWLSALGNSLREWHAAMQHGVQKGRNYQRKEDQRLCEAISGDPI